MGTYYSRSARAIRSVYEFGREFGDPGARELAPGLVKGSSSPRRERKYGSRSSHRDVNAKSLPARRPARGHRDTGASRGRRLVEYQPSAQLRAVPHGTARSVDQGAQRSVERDFRDDGAAVAAAGPGA